MAVDTSKSRTKLGRKFDAMDKGVDKVLKNKDKYSKRNQISTPKTRAGKGTKK